MRIDMQETKSQYSQLNSLEYFLSSSQETCSGMQYDGQTKVCSKIKQVEREVSALK